MHVRLYKYFYPDDMDTHPETNDTGLSALSQSGGNSYSKEVNSENVTNNFSAEKTKESHIYYAVHVPTDSLVANTEANECLSTVFKDKMEALQLVKKFKKARFKVFHSLSDATQFTVDGVGFLSSVRLNQSLDLNAVLTDNAPTTTDSLFLGEKSPFRGPKTPELLRFRKAIESDDYACVSKTIWENPRYLVSSGDTPSILQEGSRYNALHVCAKMNRAQICALILKTVADTRFIRRLYGEARESDDDRCNVLLDLYLNTPDKGNNETPLHFAVKYGSYEVVQVLVAYPECDKTVHNKYGKLAKEMICSRVNGAGECGELYNKISMLLEDQYFVPVLRSPDASIQPTVGQPFSPTSPLQLSGDVLNPVMEVHGVAGPMTLNAAREFRRKWKTPTRDPKSPVSPALKTILKDTDKGLEKVGRELAEENKVNWQEFWPFLDKFVDLRTEAGLELLEQHLLSKFQMASDSGSGQRRLSFHHHINKTRNDNADTKSSPAPVILPTSTLCANTKSSPASIISPISTLCTMLQTLKLNDSNSGKKMSSAMNFPPMSNTSSNCRTEENYNGILHGDDSSFLITPHLYIEKSCQVFSKRLADALLRNPETPVETMACEAAYVNMLVTSCLDDTRFQTVNFSRLHSRLSSCLVGRFSSDDRDVLEKAIECVLNKLNLDDSSSSDEEIKICRDKLSRQNRWQNKEFINATVKCIAQHVSKYLADSKYSDKHDASLVEPGPLSNEEDYVKLWQSYSECSCPCPPQCNRIRNSMRRSNFTSVTRGLDFSQCKDVKTNECGDSVVRKDCDLGDIVKRRDSCDESSGDDTSDTENTDFYTPPMSPADLSSMASSEDDLGMESPDEGPEVFIVGDVPTSADNAVLEAISQKDLDPAVYPSICRWKHLVHMHSPAQRERWPSPRKNTTNCTQTPQRNTSVLDRFSKSVKSI